MTHPAASVFPGDSEMAARALDAATASEARFRTVQDASPLGFAIHRPVREGGRPDGRVVDFTLPYVNAAGARIVGRSRDELMAGTVLGIWPGTGPEGVFADYVRVLETGAPLTREILYEHDELAAGLTLTVVRIGEGADAEIGVTFADVTERLRGERERARLLAESEAARAAADLEARRLATVLEHLPIGVTLAEAPEGRLLLSNAAVRRLWGVDPPAARVADYSALYVGFRPGTDHRYASDEWPLARALARGEVVTDEVIEIERPDMAGAPERRLLSVSAAPVRDAAGAVAGGVVASRDVTDERRGEEERRALIAQLAAERAALREIILQTPAPLALLVGPEHRFELVNDAYKRVSGGGRDVTGLTPPEAFPELAGSGIYELFDRVYETGEPWDGPETLCRYDRDGTGVIDTWFNLRFEPVRDGDGRVYALLNFAVDVTEQVRARREVERMLAESERARAEVEAAGARAEAVLASIADAFYLLDRDWRFTYVNDAAEPLLQTTRDRLLGRTLWDAFPAVAGSVFEGPYREAMDTGRVTSAEAYFAPLGTWFDVRSYPWPGGLMVHFRDIGARKTAEAERERLFAAAEAANQAKSEFLAVMSHELRTPLNAIGGYAELMELGIHGPVTPEQRQALARIQQSQRHLLGLINQVLSYTRLDAGGVAYDLVDVPVAEALGSAEALVLPQARARGLTYVLGGCPPGLAARADRDKLQQILLNLLSNAIKFTEPGGEVRVTCAADEGAVRVEVRDTGVGIAAHQLTRIFEPFVQADQRLTRPHEGVGLGLAISRDLAGGMGGGLTVESTPGVGSAFTLTLPRA